MSPNDGVDADQLLARHPVQFAASRVDIENIAGEVFDKDGVGRLFEEMSEKRFAVLESQDGLFARGDVAPDPNDAGRLAVRVA